MRVAAGLGLCLLIGITGCVTTLSPGVASADLFERPARPDLPWGDTQSQIEMEQASDRLTAYTRQMVGYQDCLQNEIFDAEAESRQVNDQWEEAKRRFEGQ